MSWAPWSDPKGRYILFASNKLGFSNFEVYLVDIDGKGAGAGDVQRRIRRLARAVPRRAHGGLDLDAPR